VVKLAILLCGKVAPSAKSLSVILPFMAWLLSSPSSIQLELAASLPFLYTYSLSLGPNTTSPDSYVLKVVVAVASGNGFTVPLKCIAPVNPDIAVATAPLVIKLLLPDVTVLSMPLVIFDAGKFGISAACNALRVTDITPLLWSTSVTNCPSAAESLSVKLLNAARILPSTDSSAPSPPVKVPTT